MKLLFIGSRLGQLHGQTGEPSDKESFQGPRGPIVSGATCLRLCMILAVGLLTPLMAGAATYYLSPSGSDAPGVPGTLNNPWLSPNHNINCGDVIIAEASNEYAYYNFNQHHWGQVQNCNPQSESVAWLECATFDGCIISSGGGIWVDQSNWGVQGWQVTTTLQDSGCFSAAPTGSSRSTTSSSQTTSPTGVSPEDSSHLTKSIKTRIPGTTRR